MKPNDNIAKVRKSNYFQGEGPNWVFIVGGALLSTLSIRVGCRLKQAFDGKQAGTSLDGFAGARKTKVTRRAECCQSHAHLCPFHQDDENNCYKCRTGGTEIKRATSSSRVNDSDPSLQLVTLPLVDSNKENSSSMWAPSPERIEFTQHRPLNHSNSSESPCISESGSDILNKREVINKLRQQLRRRDEMIMEMQAQISDLQSSLSSQIAHSVHLQSQLDSSNRDLFESESEIQRLRKAIADHAAAEITSPEMFPTAPNWHTQANGHSNGFVDSINGFDFPYIGAVKNREIEKVEMLKNEVQELKEVIEGKDFLIQSYKEQKLELSTKLKEMQLRLPSQVPNIL